MKKAALAVIVIGVAAGGTLWAVAAPARLPDEAYQALPEPDLANGEQVFWATGCASCHQLEGDAGQDAEGRPILGGGHALESEFGTFVAPNISPSDTGIGGWSFDQFANAVLRGVAPDGSHYYPAFPYGSYAMMTMEDVNDLWGFIATLPESDNRAPESAVDFPYSINRAVGLWKYLYLNDQPRIEIDTADPALTRGRYLVEGLGHCGECHTPRDALGGLDGERWLAGAPNPSGDGRIPNITPGGAIADWSAGDIAYYLESGFTPDFDSVGGSMAAVQRGMARLSAEDRDAIAAYLKAIPAHESENQ